MLAGGISFIAKDAVMVMVPLQVVFTTIYVNPAQVASISGMGMSCTVKMSNGDKYDLLEPVADIMEKLGMRTPDSVPA
jgi:hypothetical protein